MTQEIRDKIAELTKNLTPHSELIPISKAESGPQTGPGRTAAWSNAKRKLESVREKREVVVEVATSSIDINPEEICRTTATALSSIDIVVRRHPESPERFQCVDKRWEQRRVRIDANDHVTVIVGEFSDLEMRAIGRYNPLD